MIDRKALQRALHREKLEHVEGWVDHADAAPIRAKIAKHKPRVDAIKADLAAKNGTGPEREPENG